MTSERAQGETWERIENLVQLGTTEEIFPFKKRIVPTLIDTHLRLIDSGKFNPGITYQDIVISTLPYGGDVKFIIPPMEMKGSGTSVVNIEMAKVEKLVPPEEIVITRLPIQCDAKLLVTPNLNLAFLTTEETLAEIKRPIWRRLRANKALSNQGLYTAASYLGRNGVQVSSMTTISSFAHEANIWARTVALVLDVS
jgi:hypothetical protein